MPFCSSCRPDAGGQSRPCVRFSRRNSVAVRISAEIIESHTHLTNRPKQEDGPLRLADIQRAGLVPRIAPSRSSRHWSPFSS